MAGVGLQAVFANPLVSPDTLGVASGVGFAFKIADKALILGMHQRAVFGNTKEVITRGNRGQMFGYM